MAESQQGGGQPFPPRFEWNKKSRSALWVLLFFSVFFKVCASPMFASPKRYNNYYYSYPVENLALALGFGLGLSHIHIMDTEQTSTEQESITHCVNPLSLSYCALDIIRIRILSERFYHQFTYKFIVFTYQLQNTNLLSIQNK